MKKIIKNRIFIVIITMIICISGTLYATTKYNASEISYNPINGEPTNVNDALDELYSNNNNKFEKTLILENYKCNDKNASYAGNYGKVMEHTIDVSNIEGYEELDASNFIVEIVGIYGSTNAKKSASKETSKEYDKETGILLLKNYGHVWGQETNNGYCMIYATVNIWLIR